MALPHDLFMKRPSLLHYSLAVCLLALATCDAGHAQNASSEIFSEDFSSNTVGDKREIAENSQVTDLEFPTGWRLFNVDNSAQSFTAEIVSRGNKPGLAVRLKVDGLRQPAGVGLDRFKLGSRIPVSGEGAASILFESRLISGDGSLDVSIAEYDSAGKFLDKVQHFSFPLAGVSWEPQQINDWKPKDPSTAEITICIVPVPNGDSVEVDVANIHIK